MTDNAAPHVLDALYRTVEARKGADPEASYTARLLSDGVPKVARKMGEEAVEAVIAAVEGDKDALAGESADLLYHLVVLWAAAGVTPEDVWGKLAGRAGTSGLAEKQARREDGRNSLD